MPRNKSRHFFWQVIESQGRHENPRLWSTSFLEWVKTSVKKVFDPLQKLIDVRLRYESVGLGQLGIPPVGICVRACIEDDWCVMVELSDFPAQFVAVLVRQ